MKINAGSTNVSVYFNIVEDVGGTNPGEPKTGLLFSDIETGGSASFMRQGGARVDLTLITLASASAVHADGGFILVDDTNMPGLYRCDYPDAAFAAGVDLVICQIVVAAANNAIARPLWIELTKDDVNVIEWLGTAVATPTTAGVPEVDVTFLGGVAQSLFDLKDFADAGYDPATNQVEGVKLNDTTTTNTDMRGTDSALLAADINLTAGAVDNVTLVVTTTINTDMRGTDSAFLAANAPTNFSDLNIIASLGTVKLQAVTHTGAVIPTVSTLTGHTAQTGDNFARLGAPVGADISDDIAAVKADTIIPAKNVAFANISVLMVDDTDHVTPKTGLSVTGQRSIDGGGFVNVTGSIAEISNGIYQFDASQADMNGDVITFKFSGTDADDTFLTIVTR